MLKHIRSKLRIFKPFKRISPKMLKTLWFIGDATRLALINKTLPSLTGAQLKPSNNAIAHMVEKFTSRLQLEKLESLLKFQNHQKFSLLVSKLNSIQLATHSQLFAFSQVKLPSLFTLNIGISEEHTTRPTKNSGIELLNGPPSKSNTSPDAKLNVKLSNLTSKCSTQPLNEISINFDCQNLKISLRKFND